VTTSERIDAHHHFWDPDRYHYPWMVGAAMDPVRRRFGPEDLRPVLDAAGIDGTVLVQTLSDPNETDEFLQLAQDNAFIRGVVGWADLVADDVGDHLDRILSGPLGRWLVGIRHQVHDEADEAWLGRADVRRGLAAVAARGLSYDILVRSRELPAATKAIEALPSMRFVLDHIAKPRVASGADGLWESRMAPLARLPNVTVKLSGMVTEADWLSWTPADLRPFVSKVLDWFGPDRLMFGSDWPVCLLAGSYPSVQQALAESVGRLNPSEEDALYGGTARQAYRLEDRVESGGRLG
jgi:L-fuconolactonase